jgi:type IV fimbrial biogenesis protein FimT
MDSRSNRYANRGVTLLELVTVMAVVGILMAIAMPTYKYITNTNRIAAEVNALLGDMQYARAEAIKEGQPVTVCVSNIGNTACLGATVTTWEKGWIVFSDANNDHTVGANDALLRRQAAFTGTDTFRANNSVGYVTFNREGFATGSIANGALITLHASPAQNASTRCLSVTLVGLMTVQTYGQSINGVTCS